MQVWWNGRHKRLKISRGQPRAGSSPATCTINVVNHTANKYIKVDGTSIHLNV